MREAFVCRSGDRSFTPSRTVHFVRWKDSSSCGYCPGMPTIARIGPYRFFFYGNEGLEPPHIHVQRDRSVAKFWLRPVALASAGGFAGHELRQLYRLVEENREHFEEAWREFFSA